MNLFIIYISKQLLGPFLLFMITMTGVAWLTQSLRFIELIIIKGLPINLFFYLTILIIPKLIATIIPFLAYLSSLITYLRLSTESEIIAMRTAGINNFKIILPTIIFGLFLGCISIFIENYISPYSFNKFKDLQYNIRDNYISVLFQEKVFTQPVSDLTVFIKEKDNLGNFKDILIHDARDKNKVISVVSENGKIEQTINGAKFTLFNGNRQEITRTNTSILYFEKYTLNINKSPKKINIRFKEANERKLFELLNPNNNIDNLYKKEFLAEAHKRIMTPFIIILMAILGAISPILGKFQRKVSIKKILFSVSCAICIQIYIIASPQLIISYSNIIPILYLPIFFTLITILFLLSIDNKKLKYKLLNNNKGLSN